MLSRMVLVGVYRSRVTVVKSKAVENNEGVGAGYKSVPFNNDYHSGL